MSYRRIPCIECNGVALKGYTCQACNGEGELSVYEPDDDFRPPVDSTGVIWLVAVIIVAAILGIVIAVRH